MSRKRKIAVVTGTRAEYGLLYWILKGLQQDVDVTLQLVVTGAHLSPEFGLTYQQIITDGFTIDAKVEMLLSSDTQVGINKSIGLGVIGMGEAFDRLQPDLLLVLGDRYEILAAATAAMISRVPVAHLHGGESTEGAVDESIRHAITKMSQLHFTATEIYRRRVIQLGEQPDKVFNTGAPGIENINRLPLLDRAAFEESIQAKLGAKNILITFHPVTQEASTAEGQFRNLLTVLEQWKDARLIFTKANADTDGRIINQMIDAYVAAHRDQAVAFTSLGQLRYLSALQHVDVVVGNSSSGIAEVPSFKKPTVDIGDRQKGRIMAASIIHCEPTTNAINVALQKAFDPIFLASLADVDNPYGKGDPSEEIIGILKHTPLDNILKKRFYDL